MRALPEGDLLPGSDWRREIGDRLTVVGESGKLQVIGDRSPRVAMTVEIFFSYSRQDKDLRDELARHLVLMERAKIVESWHDRDLLPGSDWRREIGDRLRNADLILLLMSPDFFASDYCDEEMRVALERWDAGEARVIPVLLRPAEEGWKNAPCGILSALPGDGVPVTSWRDRDTAFAEIAEGIRRVVEAIANQKPSQEEEIPARSRSLEVPFIAGQPIARPCDFFGRKKELRRIFDLFKRPPLQNAVVIGKKRTGKTSLLNYLRAIATTPQQELRPQQKSDWLPQPERYCWVYVDFQDARLGDPDRLLCHLLAGMGLRVPQSGCTMSYFMDEVSDRLSRPTVVLLDEVGVALERCSQLDDGFWESLRSLASHSTNGNLGFVLATHVRPEKLAQQTGHSSPFFNIFGYTARLGALTDAEARELIACSPIPFSEADIAWILETSGRMPMLLQILCRERLFSLQEGDKSEAWREEGWQQIEPFIALLE